MELDNHKNYIIKNSLNTTKNKDNYKFRSDKNFGNSKTDQIHFLAKRKQNQNLFQQNPKTINVNQS